MSRSDRTDAAMLALPVLLLALTIVVARLGPTSTPNEFAGLTPNARHALMGIPPAATPVRSLSPTEVAHLAPAPSLAATSEPSLEAAVPVFPPPATVPQAATEPASAPPDSPPPPALHADAPDVVALPAEPPSATLQSLSDAAPRDPIPPAAEKPQVQLATLPALPSAMILPPADRSTVYDLPGGTDALQSGLSQCRFEPTPAQTPLNVTWSPADPDSFGLALAAAARRQLSDFVIYNDRYTRLKYPMGDVHPMYGVCTDVVIRAYRALGLDLQELVQKTRMGSGDPNIDHRRVDTLRKFFSRFGESLPISTFAEDYKAGDIVTYWRPQNRHSRTHIAIVSDMVGPSGRPLIIHNRGWGPQQEDGLFVDEITGHYRFSGIKTPGEGTKSSANAGSSDHPTLPLNRQSLPPRPLLRTNLSPPVQPGL